MLFTTTLQQVSILLTFIFIGYFFKKKNIINDSGRKVLAALLVNLFAPAYSIVSLSSTVSVENISEYLILFLAGVFVSISVVFIAIPFAKLFAKEKFQQNILKYAFAFGNIGYFGYPLVYGVFGEVARSQMIMFCLPMSILIYSYGYHVLTASTDNVLLVETKKEKKSFFKKVSFLYNPPMIGAYIGIALGLLSSGLKFEVPKFFNDLVTVAGNCQSAPAMLITGAVLANVPLKKLFTSWKPYVIGLIRLIVFPLIFALLFAIIYLLGWRSQTFLQVAFIAIVAVGMPVGMNVVVYPESVGKDSTEGAKTCFISYVLALIVLPLIFSLTINVLGITF